MTHKIFEILGKAAITLFVLLLVMPAAKAHSSNSDVFFDKEAPIEVTGDIVTYETETETYYAEGSVEVVQAKTRLVADKVVFDMGKGTAEASGNVKLTDADGDILYADHLELDMNDETAVAVVARLFFKEGNVHLWGDTVSKAGPYTYTADEATFTTCDCEVSKPAHMPPEEVPPWSFYSSSALVEAEKVFKARNVYFYVKKLPVFYAPYVRLPIKTRRSTGFLFPKFGYSSVRGTKLDNAFFWAINESQDATFYLDYESKRGEGKGVEYRYIRSNESYGELYAYHFREKDIERLWGFRSEESTRLRPFTADSDRWNLKYTHREYLPGGVNVKVDIDLVSDDEYYFDMGESTKERSVESLESSVSITKNWDRYSLVVQGRYFDNLLVEDAELELHKLPEVIFRAHDRRLGKTPFYLSLDTFFVNFDSDEQIEGRRLDASARLSLPMRPFGAVRLTPSITPRVTTYALDKRFNGNTEYERYLYEIRMDASTRLSRYYPVKSHGLSALKNVIIPELSYVYIPPVDQNDHPRFDTSDLIRPENRFDYSVYSILYKSYVDKDSGTSETHDVMIIELAQSFDLRESMGDSRVDPKRPRPFSDLSAELRLKPSRRLQLGWDGDYDVYDKALENAIAYIQLRDILFDSFRASYNYRKGGDEYLETNLGMLLSERYVINYHERYSIKNDESLEREAAIRYKHQCYGVELSYGERPEESIIMLKVSLLGIGDVFSATAGVLR